MALRNDRGQRSAADPQVTGISPAGFFSGKKERAHSIAFSDRSCREYSICAGQYHVQAVRHLSPLPVRRLFLPGK